MNYKLSRLKNGLRIITVPISNMESATVTIWVDVGSRFENKRISGISHFLEHMVFKGSKKRPSAKLISEAIDSFGGEFNASTGKEWTNFYIKARSAMIPVAFDVLADMVLNPILKSEEIEKEKGVIVEEIRMYEDTPMLHIGDVFENLIFSQSPLGQDIIGTKETVKGLKRADFVSYRRVHYGSNNIVITVAGGIQEAEILKLAKKYFAKLEKRDRDGFVRFNPSQKKPQFLLHSQKKEQAHFVLGFLSNPMGHKDRFVEAVLSAILGGGMSSRLFLEVREKRGLAYSVRTSISRYKDIGYQEMYAGVDVGRVEEAIKVSLDQHYGLAHGEYKISNKELAKAKEFLKGHLALSLEETKAINRFFGVKELKLGQIETPDEVYQGLEAVTREDVLRVAKEVFVPERLNLAIIGPYKSAKRFESLIV